MRTALAEFPEDRELAELERLAEGALGRAAEAEEWLQRGQKLCFDRQFGEGLEALRKAASLDNRNAVIRAALLNALVEEARSVLGQDWRAAEPLIEQALNIDGGHPLARSLQGLVLDYKRQEILNDCVSQAREMQANGDLSEALAKVEQVLVSYPNEVRLVQLRATLRNLGAISAPALVPAGQSDGAPAASKPEASGCRHRRKRFRLYRSCRRSSTLPLPSIAAWRIWRWRTQGVSVPAKQEPVRSGFWRAHPSLRARTANRPRAGCATGLGGAQRALFQIAVGLDLRRSDTTRVRPSG